MKNSGHDFSQGQFVFSFNVNESIQSNTRIYILTQKPFLGYLLLE